MVRLIPLFSMVFNFYFLWALEGTISAFLPQELLPLNSFLRTVILFTLLIFFLYTPFGQRIVAFIVRGRNTIGREERVLQPVIELLKDRTDIRGYSAPVWVQLKFLSALNTITGRKIKALDRRVNRIKYEYMTGTGKIFTFDSLDLDSNSYGNTIFISKGAIDTLTQGELTALVYNEFAQIKANISNKRLLHDAGVLLGRISSILLVVLGPFALAFLLFKSAIGSLGALGGASNFLNETVTQQATIISGFILGLLRVITMVVLKALKINFTQLPYMFYERKIFIEADRATHKAGFAADMLSYLEKLYVFKLNPKDLTKLFAELRPLVAYRINYFDNVLGNNRELSADNYAWSSNYLERVQTLNNHKI